MTKPVGGVAAIGTALLVSGSTATVAADSSDAWKPGPGWHRYHQSDVTEPAGERCAFRVFEKVRYDREYYKPVTTYDNGKPQAQLFRGPLIMRFKNLRTGQAVVRNSPAADSPSTAPTGPSSR